jgi:hypothetical protein
MRVSAGSASVVRDLFNRTLETGAIAVLTVALLVVALLSVAFLGAGLMPQPARAAGLMAGPATFGGGFHSFARPALVRPGQAPPVVVSRGSSFPANRRFGFEPAHEHRRFFGSGFPVVGVGPAFWPFEVPIADVAPDAPGPVLRAAEPGSREPISVNGGDCRSETRTVPSEAGGERTIKITWCRKG